MSIYEIREQRDCRSVFRAGPPLLKLERISKLGRLGEELVAELLQHHGFTSVENSESSTPQLSLR